MTELTEAGRRVANMPAFPTPPLHPALGPSAPDGVWVEADYVAGRTGPTFYQHAALELMKALWVSHDDAERGPGFDWEDFKVHCAMDSMQGATALCNALGEQQEGGPS